jgi:hypothetical protein
MYETQKTVAEIIADGRKIEARLDAAFASIGIDVTKAVAPRQALTGAAKLKAEVAVIEAANAQRRADKARVAEIKRHLPVAEHEHRFLERGPQKDRFGRVIMQARAELARIEAGR